MSTSACIALDDETGRGTYAVVEVAGKSMGSAGDSASAESGATTKEDCTEDAGQLSGAVDLGAAGDFVILAKTGIATVDTSTITGNVAEGPDAPAIDDMERAFADAASCTPEVRELGAGDIGGMTIGPGVYAWTTSLSVPGNVTLSGSETDVWIFQVAGDLLVSASKNITLRDGARAENVVWQVNGKVILGLHAHIEGTTLARASITLGQSASVYGRLLAQTSVHLDYNTITEPEHPIVLKSRCAEAR